MVGTRKKIMELFVPSPPLMMVLMLIVKLSSEVLEVGTVDKNEYNDNRRKYVAKQR